jgi:hypothetical protein
MGNVACDGYLITADSFTEKGVKDLKEKWYNIMQKGVVVKMSSGLWVSTSTFTTRQLSDEEQFYQDMRDAIAELQKEEKEQNQQWWQLWYDSYCISGLY